MFTTCTVASSRANLHQPQELVSGTHEKKDKICDLWGVVKYEKHPQAEDTRISKTVAGSFHNLFDRDDRGTSDTMWVSEGTLKAFHLMDHSKSSKHGKKVANCT